METNFINSVGTEHSDHLREAEESADENEQEAEKDVVEYEYEFWEEEENKDTTTSITGESGESSNPRTGSMLTPEDDPDDPAFRDYLKRIHFIDTLTRCIIELYESPERPMNSVEHFLKLLAAASGKADEHEEIPEEGPTAQGILEKQLAELENEKHLLIERLEKCKPIISENESETEVETDEETEFSFSTVSLARLE